jgi:hypothetical protein
VALRLAALAPLFGHDLADAFVLATSPGIRGDLAVSADGAREFLEYSWEGDAPRTGLLALLAGRRRRGQRCAVLWIADDEFEHFLPGEIQGAKVAAVSFFSARYAPGLLRRTLALVEQTDYARQREVEGQFLWALEAGRRVLLRSPAHGTLAAFDHHGADHWFSLHGPLDYGQQVVLPTGQLSVLADPSGQFSADGRLALNGEVVLRGEPLVHRGSRRVTLAEAERAGAALAGMRDSPVIAHVRDGVIAHAEAARPGPNAFLDALRGLFEEDPRYRKIQEVCFGTNPRCSPLRPGNFFPNYRHPGVVFGLGLGGHTRFHYDLVCPGHEVLCETGGGTVNVTRLLGL